jgi:hypothetical protein
VFGKGLGLQDALDGDFGDFWVSKKSSRKKRKSPGPNFMPIGGVTVPEVGRIKAWELTFGEDPPRKFACFRPSEGQVFLLDGECSKCAFDLWQGELVVGSAVKGNADKPPRVG